MDRLAGGLPRLHPAGHRRLQAREREVKRAIVILAPGEADRRRIAVAGRLVDRRPAGKGHAEYPGHLVVRLAGRVVDGGAERNYLPGHVRDEQQRGMAAGHEQGHRRRRQRAVFELVDGDVRGQVVDPVQRLAQRERIRLGRGHPDEQGADQPRPRGDGHGVDLLLADASGRDGPVEGRDHGLQVRPAGHLRHHAAEPRVLIHAGGNAVSEQCVTADQPDACLVAGGLDAKHQRRGHHASAFRMTTALAPDGW